MEEIKIGTAVQKYFEGHGYFRGTVVAQVGPYYRVLFEDGDDEDLEAEEIRKCMVKETSSMPHKKASAKEESITAQQPRLPTTPTTLKPPERMSHLPGIDLQGNYLVEIRQPQRLGVYLGKKGNKLFVDPNQGQIAIDHPDVLEARERGLVAPGDFVVSVNGQQGADQILEMLADWARVPKIIGFRRPGFRPAPYLKVYKDGENHDDCAICFQGGELVCCDVCPRSYHPPCLKVDPERIPARWQCHACDAEARDTFRGPPWEGGGPRTPGAAAERPIARAQAFHLWVMRKDLSGDFNLPVDWEELGLNDYPSIVQVPMDFGTIQVMLKEGEIPDSQEGLLKYVHLMRLVFFNCHLYNPKGSSIARSGETLAALFERYYLVHLRPALTAEHRRAALLQAQALATDQDAVAFLGYNRHLAAPGARAVSLAAALQARPPRGPRPAELKALQAQGSPGPSEAYLTGALKKQQNDSKMKKTGGAAGQKKAGKGGAVFPKKEQKPQQKKKKADELMELLEMKEIINSKRQKEEEPAVNSKKQKEPAVKKKKDPVKIKQPPKKQKIEIIIGKTQVRKAFPPHGVFTGTVIAYKKPYYKVEYEDGDQEEYTQTEVLDLVAKGIPEKTDKKKVLGQKKEKKDKEKKKKVASAPLLQQKKTSSSSKKEAPPSSSKGTAQQNQQQKESSSYLLML
mmetsp:Transcript_5426/g.9492  ORF Transcript_5426/g.9492 Transcript_5426/m.9492 type:complete len:684 (-) Transcript_5426:495-2546(-)